MSFLAMTSNPAACHSWSAPGMTQYLPPFWREKAIQFLPPLDLFLALNGFLLGARNDKTRVCARNEKTRVCVRKDNESNRSYPRNRESRTVSFLAQTSNPALCHPGLDPGSRVSFDSLDSPFIVGFTHPFWHSTLFQVD